MAVVVKGRGGGGSYVKDSNLRVNVYYCYTFAYARIPLPMSKVGG